MAVCAATCLPTHLWAFLQLMVLSMLTDMLDGIAARKLNQCSRFGEMLDIVADNACRTLAWLALFVVSGEKMSHLDAALCVIIPTMEWVTMMATQIAAFDNGKHWKNNNGNAPWLVKEIFRGGFWNPIGALTIAGIFGLPLAKLARLTGSIGPTFAPVLDWLIVLLYIGRAIGARAEIWVIASFLDKVLDGDRTPPQGFTHKTQ
eukprot:CAMPEP_0170179464 /NCGR_PEP_ID=MMETSP0040_2-20121228/17916_1 /TAXON_ID=641309 /ORGANISM="Lotharella oceanica, Strain CCMP622" /LENGTH=203 /DNA_ID=CAMNT_0010423577 /DNA_START=278 /DNA_END=889 /DNA_ORIENTATION=-